MTMEMILTVVLLLAAIFVATYYPNTKVGAFLNALVNDEYPFITDESEGQSENETEVKSMPVRSDQRKAA